MDMVRDYKESDLNKETASGLKQLTHEVKNVINNNSLFRLLKTASSTL